MGSKPERMGVELVQVLNLLVPNQARCLATVCFSLFCEAGRAQFLGPDGCLPQIAHTHAHTHIHTHTHTHTNPHNSLEEKVRAKEEERNTSHANVQAKQQRLSELSQQVASLQGNLSALDSEIAANNAKAEQVCVCERACGLVCVGVRVIVKAGGGMHIWVCASASLGSVVPSRGMAVPTPD